ncbi:MAG: hypothetical protein JJT96_14565 [Opitutales bacterium]|nr:hypothetical protein [Opitutales bacterium]
MVSGAPITVTATSPGPPPLTLTQRGANLASLIEQIVERQGDLAIFLGTDFTVTLDYLGAEEALFISVSSDGLRATLEIPEINFSQDFESLSPSGLNDQLQTFLRRDGSAELAAMRKEVNKRSPAGLTDGNPSSTTALIARDVFAALGGAVDAGSENRHGFRVHVTGASFKSGNISGHRYGARLDYHRVISPHVGLSAFIPLSYTHIQGARTYGIGGGLALPISLSSRGFGLAGARETSLGGKWILAPFIASSFRWSEDLGAGGAVVTYGLHTRFPVFHREGWRVEILGQISDFRGIPLKVDGYTLDSVVDQQLVKAGISVNRQLGDAFRAHLTVTGNQYWQSAAVSRWLSAETAIAWQMTPRSALQLSHAYHTGSRFTEHTGQLMLRFSF